MAGGMGVTKNKYIEAWAYRRENIEYYFKYSKANWARLAVFGFAVPMAAYTIMAAEMAEQGSFAHTFFKREYNVDPEFLFFQKKEGSKLEE